MCIKHVNVCCHCGELMEPHWTSCEHHLLLTRDALSQDPPLEEPLHRECKYLKSDTHPMLQGCVNNDSCPSWLWNVLVGLVDIENDGWEVIQAHGEFVRANYAKYQREFAKNHFTRRPLLVRENFGEFLKTAYEDLSVSFWEDSSDDEMDDEEEKLILETDFLSSPSSSVETSSASPALSVHFEINPELPSREIFPAKGDSPDPKNESPPAKSLAMEYQDLIAPIRERFFSNDSDTDTEVS